MMFNVRLWTDFTSFSTVSTAEFEQAMFAKFHTIKS